MSGKRGRDSPRSITGRAATAGSYRHLLPPALMRSVGCSERLSRPRFFTWWSDPNLRSRRAGATTSSAWIGLLWLSLDLAGRGDTERRPEGPPAFLASTRTGSTTSPG